jgi:pimeloyl-ACP methyl ester carboxylesterase
VGAFTYGMLASLMNHKRIAQPLSSVVSKLNGKIRPSPVASKLHVVQLGGAGSPLVFLHGVGGTHRYWLAGPRPLAFPAHKTMLVDLLGFGDSPRPWCRYTVDRHLEALDAALAGQNHMTLVGHSMGAVLAVAYAARHPALVRRLFLLGLPYFGSQANAYRWFRRTPGGWIYTNMVATALACMFTRRVIGKLLPYLLRDIPRSIAEDLVKHTFLSSTTSMWEVLYRHNLAADARALPVELPVYCLHGTRDSTAPVGGMLRLATGRPNWHVALLDEVDHHPWLRQPERCRELIVRALGNACDAQPAGFNA